MSRHPCPLALLLLAATLGCGDDELGADGGEGPPPDARASRDLGDPTDGATGSDGCVPTFEICGDRVDQDCDGRDTSCGNADGDFFDACRAGETPPECDCDDARASAHPGAQELCNEMDDDCDGLIDEVAECCPACAGMAERADACTTTGACVCSSEGAGDAPCPSGRVCCSSGCVDTDRDREHCGVCEAACTSQADRCEDGLCRCGTGPACACDVMCVAGACMGGC